MASRKDYIAISNAIASENELLLDVHEGDQDLVKALEEKRTLLAMKIADNLLKSNPKFDRAKFMSNCDLTA